jgi:hypothetical protein
VDRAAVEWSQRTCHTHTVELQGRILDKTVDYLVLREGTPLLAVEANFFSSSGSKPSEVLERAYPELQRDLASVSVELAVVTDGAGWLAMPRVLERAFQKLAHLMNMRQAESGELVGVLSDSAGREANRRRAGGTS